MPIQLKGEEVIQAECMAELRKAGVLAFHPVNEGKRKRWYTAKLKRLGMLTGVADIIIMEPPPAMPEYPGAVLELKMPGNKPTPDQEAFLLKAHKRGWAVAWAVGMDASLGQLRTWGYIP